MVPVPGGRRTDAIDLILFAEEHGIDDNFIDELSIQQRTINVSTRAAPDIPLTTAALKSMLSTSRLVLLPTSH
jgi:hypothetical protein